MSQLELNRGDTRVCLMRALGLHAGSFQHYGNNNAIWVAQASYTVTVGGTPVVSHPQDQERTLNLSIHIVSGPGCVSLC